MYNLNEREMRMQVRLFYNDFCKDIPLDGKSKFSIGSGKNDGFCLSDSDLKKNHVVLTTQKNGWQIVCNGDTFLRGATLKKGPLQMSVTYVLEMSRNVQSGNTQNLKSMVIQRSFPKWSVAERRKTAAASD